MTQNDASGLESWFEAYSQSFLTGREDIDVNLRLKMEHSRRVRDQILELGRSLHLSSDQLLLCQAIGLLHDTGRFAQFIRYRTFKDSQSVDHADLGLAVLHDERVLANLSTKEQNTINKAIENHNKRHIAPSVSGDDLMYCRLIRDADKLDILDILVRYYEAPESAPYAAHDDYAKDNSYSMNMIEAILTGEPIAYADVHTTIEMKLLRMAWVLDMTYPQAIQVVKNKGYIDRIHVTLPKTEDIQRVYRYLKKYMAKMLQNS